MKKAQVRPKKSLGQNFLTSHSVIGKMVSRFDLKPGEWVLEIGPGLGFLTEDLLELGVKVLAIEYDSALAKFLPERFANYGQNFQLIHGDVLKVDLNEAIQSIQIDDPIKVVGNLPYNIATTIIVKLLEHKQLFSDIWAMTQKEVADRIVSAEGSKSYGRLSIVCGLHAHCKKSFDIKNTSFSPPPKVTSSVVRLTPNEFAFNSPLLAECFDQIVRAGFQQRRKTLKNALKKLFKDNDEINQYINRYLPSKIDLQWRAEKLSVSKFLSLAESILAFQQRS